MKYYILFLIFLTCCTPKVDQEEAVQEAQRRLENKNYVLDQCDWLAKRYNLYIVTYRYDKKDWLLTNECYFVSKKSPQFRVFISPRGIYGFRKILTLGKNK